MGCSFGAWVNVRADAAPARGGAAGLADARSLEFRAAADALADMLNRYFETVVTEFYAQSGTGDEIVGDGILIFFRRSRRAGTDRHTGLP